MTLRSSVVLNRLLAKVRVRHLQALARLAELGNVNRAAQAMGMTQPAVTLLLADLERLMEAPLFVRHARGVTPTPLARELLPLVRQMLGRLEEQPEARAQRCRIAPIPGLHDNIRPVGTNDRVIPQRHEHARLVPVPKAVKRGEIEMVVMVM